MISSFPTLYEINERQIMKTRIDDEGRTVNKQSIISLILVDFTFASVIDRNVTV